MATSEAATVPVPAVTPEAPVRRSALDGAKTPLTRFLYRFNDVLHHPYVEPIAWLFHWAFFLFILAPLCIIGLVVVFIWDVVTGKIFSKKVVTHNNRAILVTGCDTGFGHEVCQELARQEWHVYAGCLRQEGMDKLNTQGIPTLRPVLMDVTKTNTIDQTVQLINREHPEGLFALINNAGVGVGGMLDWRSIEHFRFVMEVNFFGALATTKACLPLLKKTRGSRIVNITSMAGIMPGQGLMGAYSASKHAADAWSQSLRVELEGWDIKVIRINPSFHDTPIVAGAISDNDALWSTLDASTKAEYGEDFPQKIDDTSPIRVLIPWNPANVQQAIVHATTSTYPKEQYLVGCDAKFIMPMLRMLPTRVNDILERLLVNRQVLVPACREVNPATTTTTNATTTTAMTVEDKLEAGVPQQAQVDGVMTKIPGYMAEESKENVMVH